MVERGEECKSDDKWLGKYNTPTECAKACKENKGCKFFIFGTGSKTGKCYWEKTLNAACPEGWYENDYDFYTMKGMKC